MLGGVPFLVICVLHLALDFTTGDQRMSVDFPLLGKVNGEFLHFLILNASEYIRLGKVTCFLVRDRRVGYARIAVIIARESLSIYIYALIQSYHKLLFRGLARILAREFAHAHNANPAHIARGLAIHLDPEKTHNLERQALHILHFHAH